MSENDCITPETNDEIIKPINKGVVHRICSGQVVLSLSIAVKELIENSIDAGATIIDVVLQDHGAEVIQVCDNGSGVLPVNFQSLTLKHYTSKIRDFNDLQSLGTLGFRGEALSSLCALSDLTITTRHSSVDNATQIVYDCNGQIVSMNPTAREKGTTVTLSKLFSSLPVRRKEFLKNKKREFNKMCQILYAYCLVSKGIKFTCTNTTEHGSKSTIVSTDGKQTVRENIVNVFGPKQIATLIEINLVPPDEETLTEFALKPLEPESIQFSFEFFISSVIHGSGRSAVDRQFYFINSRPCDSTKLSKLVNGIYKQYNSNQYPFVYLNIATKSNLIDVNITPDKRQIFIENEKILLATIKSSLNVAFKEFPSTFKTQNLELSGFVERRGVKRSCSDGSFKKGSLIETFKKKSKSAGSTASNIEIKTLDDFISKDVLNESEEKLDELIEIACRLVKDDDDDDDGNNDIKKEIDSVTKNDIIINDLEIVLDQQSNNKNNRKSILFNISLEEIQKYYSNKTESNETNQISIKFRSKIKNEDNKNAEIELQKEIKKSDFNEMIIIGQFNKGFIITRLKDDLFIIDQHASDEKYNFEMLQLNTVVDSQKLVQPKPLELTAGNEDLLIENIGVFNRSGFSFKINHEAPCTKKVALTSIPISRNFVFSKDDIDEMLMILQESSNNICVPSKLRKMFASRACRKSVMIGTDLTKNDMRKIVDQMGQIEQPWNCPHGRPTMRHLINLGMLGDL